MAFIVHTHSKEAGRRHFHLRDLWLTIIAPFMFASALIQMVSHPEHYSFDDEP
jgi:hypothetical protein